MIFSKSYLKILQTIYYNPEIRLTDLIKKCNMSVDTAKKRLNELLRLNVIVEKRVQGGKRTILRTFYPNFESEEGLYIFSLIELEKRDEFFKKNKTLLNPFRSLVRELKDIDIILVFGSFARFSQTKESDLDILFIVNKKYEKEKIRDGVERSFVTIENEVSPRISNISDLKKSKVLETIKQDHIIIKGVLKFIKNFCS